LLLSISEAKSGRIFTANTEGEEVKSSGENPVDSRPYQR
jgi:hypothetical protein